MKKGIKVRSLSKKKKKIKHLIKRVIGPFTKDHTPREVDLKVVAPLGTIVFKWEWFEFNMGNRFNYASVRHPTLKRASLRGIMIPLGSTNPSWPFRRLADYSVDPLTHDTLFGQQVLGMQPKCPGLAMHPWTMYEVFGSREDYCKPNLKPL